MPTISMFRGIKISINWNDHMPPHFHAKYGDEEILVSIKELEVLEGEMQNKQLKMVLGWAAFHQTELMEDWELATKQQELFSIDPLRQENQMPNSVDFYLSKGFDLKMANYFASGRKKITSVKPNKDFTLLLVFDNTEKRIFDMKPYLKKNTVFEQFMNFDDFKRVYLDDNNCVSWDKNPEIDSKIEWNNKVDLCSDVCYVDSKPCQFQLIIEIEIFISQKNNLKVFVIQKTWRLLIKYE